MNPDAEYDFKYGFDFTAAERQLKQPWTTEVYDTPVERYLALMRDLCIAVATPARLEEYRTAWREGTIPESVGFFLVAETLLGIAEAEEDSPELRAVDERIAAIERQHGIEDREGWPIGEGPAEYQRLNREYDRLWEERIDRVFREHGEPALADLYRDDRQELHDRIARGRAALIAAAFPEE